MIEQAVLDKIPEFGVPHLKMDYTDPATGASITELVPAEGPHLFISHVGVQTGTGQAQLGFPIPAEDLAEAVMMWRACAIDAVKKFEEESNKNARRILVPENRAARRAH